MRGLAFVILLLLVSLSAAAQERECPRPRCDLKAADGRAKCEAAADWIIEADLASITDEYGRDCEFTSKCGSSRWRKATLSLSKPKAIKMAGDTTFSGAIRPGRWGIITVASSSSCWEQSLRINFQKPGTRLRLYGINKGDGSTLVLPGYFAYELIEPLK